MSRPSRPLAFATFLGVAGAMHFVVPRFYDQMIPPQLPGRPRTWTTWSGVAEIAVAASVAVPKTRRFGGLAAAWLFVCVFPGNVQMALDAFKGGKPSYEKAAMLGRLPLQIPMITWARRVRRAA